MTGFVCVSIVGVLPHSVASRIQQHISVFLNSVCISLVEKGKFREVNISGIFSVLFFD